MLDQHDGTARNLRRVVIRGIVTAHEDKCIAFGPVPFQMKIAYGKTQDALGALAANLYQRREVTRDEAAAVYIDNNVAIARLAEGIEDDPRFPRPKPGSAWNFKQEPVAVAKCVVKVARSILDATIDFSLGEGRMCAL